MVGENFDEFANPEQFAKVLPTQIYMIKLQADKIFTTTNEY